MTISVQNLVKRKVPGTFLAIVNARVYPMTVDAQPVAADTIVCDGGRIVFVGPRVAASLDGAQIVDARGGAVVPGLVDAHTHFVFAGDRVGEFRQKSEGATYEAIAKQGGGIWKTVLATRKASEEELVALAVPRLEAMRARRHDRRVQRRLRVGSRERAQDAAGGARGR